LTVRVLGRRGGKAKVLPSDITGSNVSLDSGHRCWNEVARDASRAFRAVLATQFVLATLGQAGSDLTQEFPPYTPIGGVSGSLKSVGSDTMNNVMTLWQEGFREEYPNVQTQVEGKGSSTAPPALISGTANFGPMSRAMKDAEIASFKKKFGYEPTGLKVGIDVLAVFVHRDNPISSLSMAQLDAIFSKGRRAGHLKPVRTWGDLGLPEPWKSKPITMYGRNSASGTYGYFKEFVLLGGDFKDSVLEQPGSSSVVQAVGTDRFSIGYSGIGYQTPDVRALPLAADAKSDPVPAEGAFAYSGKYPLSRTLLVYVGLEPGKPIDPLRGEFIRYMFSRPGQKAVARDGYLPIQPDVARTVLESTGLAVAPSASAEGTAPP
jgi:phosphate transport system substrate-binding protein